ncbi:MAG: hypothetical protein U1E76_12930 [Planctomycetota bacterium]
MLLRWCGAVLLVAGLGLFGWIACVLLTSSKASEGKSPVAGIIIATLLIYGGIVVMRRRDPA